MVVLLLLVFCVWWNLAPSTPQEKHEASEISQVVHEDVIFFSLLEEVQILLPLVKDSISKRTDFKVIVRGVEISGEKWKTPYPEGTPPNQIAYWLNSNDGKPLYEGLTGLLVLHKKDATHVDVVFRSGALQVGHSPIAICIDNYSVGAIEWSQDR